MKNRKTAKRRKELRELSKDENKKRNRRGSKGIKKYNLASSDHNKLINKINDKLTQLLED